MTTRTRTTRSKKRLRSQQQAASHWMRTYGLTTEDYEEIYEYQGGRCYICQYATGRTRRLSVDHCHKTGLIRGLLCAPCNKMLGRFRDNSEAGTRIIEYLDRPPAVDAIGERFVP